MRLQEWTHLAAQQNHGGRCKQLPCRRRICTQTQGCTAVEAHVSQRATGVIIRDLHSRFASEAAPHEAHVRGSDTSRRRVRHFWCAEALPTPEVAAYEAHALLQQRGLGVGPAGAHAVAHQLQAQRPRRWPHRRPQRRHRRPLHLQPASIGNVLIYQSDVGREMLSVLVRATSPRHLDAQGFDVCSNSSHAPGGEHEAQGVTHG